MTVVSAGTFDLSGWSADHRFPLTPEECVALCRGDLVEWRGTDAELASLLFHFELIDGLLMLKRRN